MRTLITGAAGRIGRGVGAALRNCGHHVIGVDMIAADVPTPQGELVGSNFNEFVQMDLVASASGTGRDADLLTGALAGCSAVVHCAAWPGPSATPPPAVEASGAAVPPSIGLEPTSPTVLLRDNVAATSSVCDAAIRANVQRMVFSSSAFAYGYSHAVRGPQSFQPHYLPIDEAHPLLPCESYGLSKSVGEQVLEAASRTASATSFVSLRFTNIVKRELWHTLPWPAPTEASPLTLLMWACNLAAPRIPS
jgi:UDP-glucose 4-epimerase